MTDANETPSSSRSPTPSRSPSPSATRSPFPSSTRSTSTDRDPGRVALTDGGGDRTELDGELEAERAAELGDDEIDFENLTLSQRIFVAAVQNPTRGILVGLLLLFGFGFYVALWVAFPRVAVAMSLVAVAVGGVIAAVLVLLK